MTETAGVPLLEGIGDLVGERHRIDLGEQLRITAGLATEELVIRQDPCVDVGHGTEDALVRTDTKLTPESLHGALGVARLATSDDGHRRALLHDGACRGGPPALRPIRLARANLLLPLAKAFASA